MTPEDVARLADAMRAVGSADFPHAFSEFCAGISGANSTHLSAFFAAARPVEIHASRTDAAAMEAMEVYFDVAYVLDPFYQVFLRATDDRVDLLRDIAPDDFRRSEYYGKFFQALGLSDECGVMLHLEPDTALFLSLGTTAGKRLRAGAVRAMLPVIGALARRHWTVLTPDRFDGTGRLAAHLEHAFAAFGESVLSPREAQIARMVLQGYSTKAIALEFDNSPETIKVHRKRIHAKLGLTTQGALLPLFLEALHSMPAGGSGDPLAYLQRELVTSIPPRGD